MSDEHEDRASQVDISLRPTRARISFRDIDDRTLVLIMLLATLGFIVWVLFG